MAGWGAKMFWTGSFMRPPNRKWIDDFPYIWTGDGWLYVAAVIDLFMAGCRLVDEHINDS